MNSAQLKRERTIIIADDHAIIRQGLRMLLSRNPEWSVVREASSGTELLSLLKEKVPDVAIVDLAMPGVSGIELVAKIRELAAECSVLVLSASSEPSVVRAAMNAGARGFIPKESTSEELVFALNAIAKGGKFLSPLLYDTMLTSESSERHQGALSCLSKRECEVLKLIGAGIKNKEIARQLHISPRTIDSHRASILRKLDAKSTAELAQIALKHGIV